MLEKRSFRAAGPTVITGADSGTLVYVSALDSLRLDCWTLVTVALVYGSVASVLDGTPGADWIVASAGAPATASRR